MPYEPHPIFEYNSGTQRIWRYLSFTKLIWITQQNKLHFHRTGDFNDPYEGTVPQAVIDLRKESLRQKDIDIDIEELGFNSRAIAESCESRSISFANCWHSSDFESAAMWEMYRKRGKPLCIESTISDLIESVEPIDEPIYIGEVAYVDHDSQLKHLDTDTENRLRELYSRSEHGNMMYPVLTKRREFEYENELRAIYTDNTSLIETVDDFGEYNEESLRAMETRADDFFNLTIDSSVLINNIYIGPSVPDWAVKAVEMYVENSGLDLDVGSQVHQSSLNNQPLDYN